MDVERAISGLTDLLIYLRDYGDKSEETLIAYRRKKAARRRHEPTVYSPKKNSAQKKHAPDAAINRWEQRRMRAWRRQGRIRSDGTLRVDPELRPDPWTISRIKRCWPHLKTFDQLAVLIELDGVISEDYLAEHRNIRLALEEIIKIGVARELSDREANLEERVDDRVETIFKSILTDIKGGTPMASDKRSRPRKIQHPETGELLKRADVYAWLKANPAHPKTMDWIQTATEEEVAEVGFDTK